ncbi:MAG: hypothetical protein MUF87_16880, partial [Anaerolineae bacterium]|nr:hypothetical protein [Anaerolineae bacterium]
AIAIVTETDFQRVTLSTSETVYRGEGQLAGVDWESAWILHDGQTITWEGSAGEARSPRPAFCDHPALSPDRSQWFDPVNMQIREVESGAMIATLPFMAELFTTQTGAWSADAQQFAVITANTEALIFSTADWTLIDRIDWRPSGNRDAIAFGRWHPEQDQLLIAAADGLRLYQQDTLIQRVETYFDLALSVAWSHDRIVTGHADGLVRVWDADTGAHLRTCEGHTSQVIKVIFINPNQILSFAGAFDQDDGRMIIWDATTCTIHETSPYVGAIPLTMIFTDNGIIGSAFSNTVRWRADGLDLISTQGFFDLARFGDQVIGVTGDSGQVMILPDQVWVDGLPTLFAIAVHPDQTVIAVGGQDGTIRLLDVESREIIRTITEHQSAIMALQWHGDRLASVSIDGDLYLHDLGHETAIELNTSERIAHELAWSADGRRLIVVGTQLIVLELTDEIP